MPLLGAPSPYAAGHLKYNHSGENPPDGPISWSQYSPAQGVKCAYDHFPISETQFSSAYIPHEQGGGGFNTVWYSFDEATCNDEVDPITVVFYGNGTLFDSVGHTEHHGVWGDTSGGTQYFLSQNSCQAMQAQRADSSPLVDRYHVRFRETAASDPTLGITTVATPHREDSVVDGCHATHANGEGGSGFDQARELIRTQFLGYHTSYMEFKGNTRTFLQCDQEYASSNGYVLFEEIP